MWTIKRSLSFRHPLPTFGSFNFFQASFWPGVNKVLQKLTKSYKSELRQLCISMSHPDVQKKSTQNPISHYDVGRSENWVNRQKKWRVHLPLHFFLSVNSISTRRATDYAHHMPPDYQTTLRPCKELNEWQEIYCKENSWIQFFA